MFFEGRGLVGLVGFCWGWVVGGYGGGVELGLGLVVGKWLVGLSVLGWGKGSLC